MEYGAAFVYVYTTEDSPFDKWNFFGLSAGAAYKKVSIMWLKLNKRPTLICIYKFLYNDHFRLPRSYRKLWNNWHVRTYISWTKKGDGGTNWKKLCLCSFQIPLIPKQVKIGIFWWLRKKLFYEFETILNFLFTKTIFTGQNVGRVLDKLHLFFTASKLIFI